MNPEAFRVSGLPYSQNSTVITKAFALGTRLGNSGWKRQIKALAAVLPGEHRSLQHRRFGKSLVETRGHNLTL